ncbi:MAG: hypothetical protein C4K58_02650 [Flavobacteriaceae bacterium]|nr:MAG: hypothetical protein C4K58_02650 [Flavobacteriaceae bacterium]
MSTEKYQLEFEINSSPKLLYSYLSTPSGLSEWFADNVNSRGEKFSFYWDETQEDAILLKSKQDVYVRFHWEDDPDPKTFFEMRITVDDLTKDVSLLIIDFAEESEKEEAVRLWESQIEDLKHTLGS